MFNLRKYSRKTLVGRDSKGQIVWVKGRPDLSILNYYEWREAYNASWGSGGMIDPQDGPTLYPPFTLKEEEV